MVSITYRVTLIVAPCSALGAATVILLLALFEILYPVVVLVAASEGSIGVETIYFSLVVKTAKSIHDPVEPVEQITVAVVVMVAGKVPLLSMVYWYTAFRMVFMSTLRCAFRVSPSCLPGLMAIITILASMAIIATTSRISSSVKPRILLNLLTIISILSVSYFLQGVN